jgi:hypothetical protein
MLFSCAFLYSCNFEFIKKKNWQVCCQFLNVIFMCFFCTRAILNLLKRKIDKYDANFWMLFSCAFFVLVQFWIYWKEKFTNMMPIFECYFHMLFLYSCNLEFIKKKNSQIWCQFLNVVFKCFFYIRAILNLLKRKIDKCGANFWNVAGMCYFRAKFM